MGTLKSLTIQPRTRARYDKAKKRFYQYLDANNLQLPTRLASMDALVCDYLEELWASGEGRALASDTLAGLQDSSPNLRGCLPGAWRLLKAWHVNELPNRAPPIPEKILQTLVGYYIFHSQPGMALSLLLGFYAMLRTGELLGVRNGDVTIDERMSSAVISLGLTKGGFPGDVRKGVQKECDAKMHQYGDKQVIHVVGPDFTNVPWASFQAQAEASQKLTRAYKHVFEEFEASNSERLRLLPISGGINAGPFFKQLPHLTFEAIDKAFRSLPMSSQHQLLQRFKKHNLEMCIFEETSLAAYQAACPTCA
eukprot:s1097_g13.t1